MREWLLVGFIFLVGCDEGVGDLDEASPDLQELDGASEGELEAVTASGWCKDSTAVVLGESEVFDACQDPTLSIAPCGGRVNLLEIGANGEEGEGLDVDGDPETCAPEGSCSAGVDNQLSILSGLAQEGIDEALSSGTLMLFLEFIEPPGGPGVFTLQMHVAVIDETSEDCDWNTEVCAYRIRHDSYDDACEPPVLFDEVTVAEDGTFATGAGGISISLNIPLFGVSVSLPVKNAQLKGTIVWGEAGHVSSMTGLLAGGIPKAELVAAIEGIPADEFEAGTSLNKETIVGALEALVINDLDLDGDGIKEAASFGAKVGSIPGVVVGWEGTSN